MAVLKGTEVSDIINGSKLSDSIQGLDGDDLLIGGLGRDSIYGGKGDDIIYAGDNGVSDGISPDDTATDVSASQYDNSLYGQDGDDLLVGSNLDDLQVGGDGDDYLRGYKGDDNLSGNAENDKIRGYLGEDTLFGNSGNDVLHGHENDDLLDGGSDNDSLHGFNDHKNPSRSNVDILTGGAGQDHFILGSRYEIYYQLNRNNDIGIITDFNVAEDIIKLHGEAGDYLLRPGSIGEGTTAGTYIDYNVYTGGETIAFVEDKIDLDLTEDYFEFV